mmetsp:Transcript_29912/g.44231  ORF Transcript_29912/g.44231 Transcript_29912/m.44231 type:complete len:214 (-) Transcript_29912:301-942(-)
MNKPFMSENVKELFCSEAKEGFKVFNDSFVVSCTSFVPNLTLTYGFERHTLSDANISRQETISMKISLFAGIISRGSNFSRVSGLYLNEGFFFKVFPKSSVVLLKKPCPTANSESVAGRYRILINPPSVAPGTYFVPPDGALIGYSFPSWEGLSKNSDAGITTVPRSSFEAPRSQSLIFNSKPPSFNNSLSVQTKMKVDFVLSLNTGLRVFVM